MELEKPAGIASNRRHVLVLLWDTRSVELKQMYEAAARVFGIGVMDDYLWLNVSALETSRMVLGAVFRVLEKWSFSQTLY